MEPVEPHTEENHAYHPNSPKSFHDLVTRFIGTVTHGDEEMTEVPEGWEDIKDEQPIIDLDDDQFLLEFLDLEEENPKEGNAKSSKQLECYMSIQDPEQPQEELEKLALNCPTPIAGDVTIPNAPYETRGEARQRLLC